MPLLVSFLLAGALGRLAGPARGPLLASASIALGLLAAYVVIAGLPRFPPPASDQKLPYLILASLLLGVALEVTRLARSPHWGPIAAGSALALVWLAWPLLRSPSLSTLALVAVLWLGGTVGLARLYEASTRDIDAPMMLLLVALAGGPIALAGASASLAQYSGALAAATGGFLLWNWPTCRHRFGCVGVFGAGGALLALFGIMVLYSEVSRLALLLLLPVFFADSAASGLPLPDRLHGRLLRPILITVVSSIPIAVAVAIAH